jgi:hypothetical protein
VGLVNCQPPFKKFSRFDVIIIQEARRIVPVHEVSELAFDNRPFAMR